MKIQVLSPKGATNQIERRLAPRLTGFDTLKMGLLSNQKANADNLLSEIAALFAEQFGCQITSKERKPDVSRPAELEMLAAIADNADFMITAIGQVRSVDVLILGCALVRGSTTSRTIPVESQKVR